MNKHCDGCIYHKINLNACIDICLKGINISNKNDVCTLKEDSNPYIYWN